MPDITSTTAPKSDQQNFDDYAAGPRTVTISEVKVLGGEQPVEIHLVEFPGRPFKPSLTNRRIIIAAWGPETDIYSGRQMTLYGDPTVKFGGVALGGIKISHLSHMPKTLEIKLSTSKGKRETFTVKPLAAAPKPPDTSHLDRLLAAFDVAGVAGDARLGYCSQLLGRPVSSPGDLTPADVDRLVTALEADGGGE